METRFNFTKPKLSAIEPTPKRVSYYDAKNPGLILLVYPSGVKTFFVQKKLAGRVERIRLGNFPTLTIEQARDKAAEVYGCIAKDQNPAALRRAVKAEPIFLEVFERYITEKRNRSGKPLAPRTAEEYRKVLDTHLTPIKTAKLSTITPDRIKSLAGKVKSPSQANKVKAILSAVFNWAEDEGITAQANPAKRIKNKLIPERERFLLPSEIPPFFAAVEASPLRDFFLLALFTGARRSNLQAMQWHDINLTEATWTIPHTKNGQPVTIALSPEALEILAERKRAAILNAVYVFPGPGKTGHLTEPKKAWAAILEAAGLENLRIHDLRRTLGSWQTRAGASLSVIGKSLGHKSQQATAIYARLDLDPVRTSVETATAALVEASKTTPGPTPPAPTEPDPQAEGGNVVPFRRRA